MRSNKNSGKYKTTVANEKYGYRLWDPRTGKPVHDHERQACLLRYANDCGVKAAIQHIDKQINRVDLQGDREKFSYAISVWVSDLKWLVQKYPAFSQTIEPLFTNYREMEIIK